jgi:hypothetical protein
VLKKDLVGNGASQPAGMTELFQAYGSAGVLPCANPQHFLNRAPRAGPHWVFRQSAWWRPGRGRHVFCFFLGILAG